MQTGFIRCWTAATLLGLLVLQTVFPASARAAGWDVPRSLACRAGVAFARETWGPAELRSALLYRDPSGAPSAWAVTVSLADGDHPEGTVMVNADLRRPPISCAWRGPAVHELAGHREVFYAGPCMFYTSTSKSGYYKHVGTGRIIRRAEVTPRGFAGGRPQESVHPQWTLAVASEPKERAQPHAVSGLIPGVPDLTWTLGCTPTSAANILLYWRSRGYPEFPDYADIDHPSAGIVGKLRAAMKTDWVPNATRPSQIVYKPGYTANNQWLSLPGVASALHTVCNDWYGLKFDIAATYAPGNKTREQYLATEISEVRTEIDAGNPLLWCAQYNGNYPERPFADVNFDGKVNSADWAMFLRQWGQQIPGEICDLNGDGIVNTADASYCLNEWNQGDPGLAPPQAGNTDGHCVAIVGYTIDSRGYGYYTVHDTFPTYPVKGHPELNLFTPVDVTVNPDDVVSAELFSIHPGRQSAARADSASADPLPGWIALQSWRAGDYDWG